MRPDAPRTRPFLASLMFLIAVLWLWSPTACGGRSRLQREQSTLEAHERPPLDFIARSKQVETERSASERASTGPWCAPDAGVEVPGSLADYAWRAFSDAARRAPVCAPRGGIWTARGPPAPGLLA